ncbi:hypothetical protein [Desertibaculum subflavum]|uniref:hypothetical protein n=1 Tax=Desertibaculum subflavum TaxID=2268458 RepID=UPI000E664869
MSPTPLAQLNDNYVRLRGASLPFTTPVIRFARARLGPESVREFVVPGLVGSRGDYMIPWTYLPELAQLTVHDRLLWEALCFTRGPLFPPDARRIAREVAASGVLGIVRAEAVRREHQSETVLRHFVHAALLSRLLAETAPEAAAELSRGAHARFRQDVVQAGLIAAAPHLGLAPAELFDRLGEVAVSVAGIGTGSRGDADDRLRHLHARLGAFAEAMHRFALEEPIETAGSVVALLQIADATHERLGALIRAVDEDLSDMRRLTSSAEARAALGLRTAEADWVADGWDTILEQWGLAEGGPRLAQRELVALLAQVTPPLPGVDLQRGTARGALAGQAAKDLLGEVDIDRVARVARRAGRVVAA